MTDRRPIDSLDRLDSRALGRTDCYGQRFVKPGAYAYNVLPAQGHRMSDERPFTVNVTDREFAKMTQHTIVVRCVKGRFTPEQREVSIDQGDLVLWNCPDQADVPYVVAGDKEFFANDRLVNECGYSHAFGSAGEYRWMDAYGSGVGGVIRVTDPGLKDNNDFEHWRQSLRRGTVVVIEEGRAEPREVEIVTGQTVFFAVTRTSGISITDERLLTQTGAYADERDVEPGNGDTTAS